MMPTKSATAKTPRHRSRSIVVLRSGDPVKFRAAMANLRKRPRAYLRMGQPGVVALLRKARDEL